MGFDIAAVLDSGPGWNKVRLTSGEIVTLQGDYNWRSNNPGNLEYGAFAQSHGALGAGATPVGRQRGFAVFPDLESGNAARIALQFESPKYRDLTIQQAIERYAPSFENDSKAYAKHVAAAAGVPITTKMSDLTSDQRERYAAAQNDFEGMRQGDIYDEQGVRLPPADLNDRLPSLLPNAPLVPGSYPGPNAKPLPPLGPSIGPAAQLVPRDTPVKQTPLPALKPSTLGSVPAPKRPSAPQSQIDRNTRSPQISPVPQSQIDRNTRPALARPSVPQTPVTRASASAPAGYPPMDASYDREQGVMVLKPSPVGEMPTLASTRAAFGLNPSLPQQAARPVPVPAAKPFVAEARYIEPRNVTPPPVKAAFVPEARYIEPRVTVPKPAVPAPYSGPFVPRPAQVVAQPAGSIVPKTEERLAQNPYGAAPLPQPPYRAVGTALDVRPMPTMPVPRPARLLTMPIARPVLPSAPVQMPIRRPVQTPVYAQQAPMRPVAAPARPALAQAGGFLFAPSSGGGYVNVGRANPQMSPAQQYAMLNSGNGGPRTAADRAGQSLSQSGGQGSFMSSSGEPYVLRSR